MLMDKSSKKSGGVENPKRNRSLDLKSLYKSRVSEVGESNKKVPAENDQGNVKKKRKRSIKEVSLGCFESDSKKSRTEDVDGVKSEQGFSQKSSGGSEGLHGISLALGESGGAFNFPKRPRDLIGRKKLVTNQASKPLGFPNSVDRAGTFNGTDDELVKFVADSAGNNGASKSKSAGKVGGSNSKVKQKADPKFKGGSDEVSELLVLRNSIDRAARAFNSKVIKPKHKAGTSDQLVTVSAGNDGASDSESEGKGVGSKSIVRQKAEQKSTVGSDQTSESLGFAKSVDQAGAFSDEVTADKAGTGGQLVKLVTVPEGNDVKSAGKVGGPNSKIKQKPDPKPNGRSNSKIKQKAGPRSIGGSDQVSESLVLNNSIDRAARAFIDKVTKAKDKAGTTDRLVTLSTGNNGVSNSKSMEKLGDSNSKSMQKVDPKSKGVSISKIKQKADPKSTGGSDQVPEPFGLHKSVDRGSASNGEFIKPKDKTGTSDRVVVGNVGASNSKSMVEIGGSNSKTKQKGDQKSTDGSNSKIKQKADPKSTGGSNQVREPFGLHKSVDQGRAFNRKFTKPKNKAGTSDQLVTLSEDNDGASNSKSMEDVGGSNSKTKQKADPKSTGGSNSKTEQKAYPKSMDGSNSIIKQKADPKSTNICGSINAKLKRKAGADELKESRGGTLRSDNEDSKAADDGPTFSKKRRINSRKKDLVIGRDGSEASKKKSEPSGGSSVSDSIFIDFDEDDDDEENLEQNAARMLSSRFDPSCTGFSSKRKSSLSQTANGFSFPPASSQDSFIQQANSSTGVDSTSADDKNRALRPRKEDKGKGMPRKRRHFYEILPRDLDPHWFLNRKIKVFWPLDESWYYGLVNDYHPECKLHQVTYDDRDEEWIDLQEEKFKVLLFPSEVPGKVKSKKVSHKDNDVHKGETVPPEDDASCTANYLDSEPIALWLARSSQHGKSLPKSLTTQRISLTELPMVTASPSDKIDDLNSDVADSKRTRNNPQCESTSADNLVLHATGGRMNGNHVVYTRKKIHKKSEGSGSVPRYIKTHRSASGTVAVSLPTAEKDKFCGFVDYDNHLWSTDHRGLLRLNVMLMESKELRFRICLPALPFSGVSLEIWDLWLVHNVLMHRYGVVSTTSPTVILEMLFIDSYRGLRFLLFEGCMKQAWTFVFLILTMLSQPDEHINGGMQSPVTSVRLRLSCVHDLRKHHVIELHSFSRLLSSKWVCLDFELLQHCVLIKELQVSECTYDNIKELECESLKQCKPRVDLGLPPYMGFTKKFLPRILPRGVSKEACNTRIGQSAGFAATSGKVPQIALFYSAAPTFFLIRHLQLLMENSFSMGNRKHHDALRSTASLENGCQLDAECNQFERSLVSVQEITGEHTIGTLETEPPPFTSLTSSKPDSVADASLVSNVVEKEFKEMTPNVIIPSPLCESNLHEQSVVSFPSAPASTASLSSDPRRDSRLGDMIIDVPTREQVDIPLDGKGYTSRQAAAVGSSVNEGFVQSPNPIWPDGSHSGFSNGPKRPRTQVQYTLPDADYDFSAKQKMQTQRALPCKRIRRASLKRISDGSRSDQRNFELLACGANVLVTHEDKGWREYGAVIVLEVADHNEWRLAIKLSGMTKYSYKVKHILQPGSTNRYSHAMMWKGGKDWVLEFPDRSQWTLFKEMYEECYNRNIRAASVKNIPIPGVRPIEESDDHGTEVHFVRNSSKYFRQVQTDVEMAMDPSHILYDIDSDDERWLVANKNVIDENWCEEILEDFFEKTMDMFEKISYVQHRDKFTDAEFQELVIGMGSVEAAKVIFEYWREKRGRKGMPLIRHLQPPLWERHQQQLKEWEHTIARSNSAAPIEKPPMFAFCLKPRGLDVPNKGSKQRSHRKFTVSGHLHAASRDHYSLTGSGIRSNDHIFGNEKVLYTSSVRESSDFSPRDANFSLSTGSSKSNRNSKVYKKKSRRLASHPSSNSQQMMSYTQRTNGNMNEVQPWNMDLPDLSNQRLYYFGGPHRPGLDHLDQSNFDEYQVRELFVAAERAKKRAKLKKEKAQRLQCKGDLVKQRAASFLIQAEAMNAANVTSNEGN